MSSVGDQKGDLLETADVTLAQREETKIVTTVKGITASLCLSVLMDSIVRSIAIHLAHIAAPCGVE